MLKRKIAFILFAAASAVSAATLSPITLLNPAGSIAGQAIVSTGSSTAPAWATVTAGGLTPIGANTVYGNFTGSSASPLANAVPSCSTANSALKYTSGTGLSCGTTFALTSGNLSQFASTTSAQLATLLSDETGSGAAVFGTSPAIASPTLSGTVAGTPTFSGAVAFSSTITPSQTAGIVGTTTNNNANAGSVGEAPANSATSVAMATSTGVNLTSVSLTAGDWDVMGGFRIVASGGATPTQILANLNTTAGAIGTSVGTYVKIFGATWAANSEYGGPVPTIRVLTATNTTVYCVASVTFASGTMAGECQMYARRRR